MNTLLGALTLTGDDNTPALPMTEAEVNHLRRLLAWVRTEWMLDEHMQRGYVEGASICVRIGAATPEQAGAQIMNQAEKIKQVPAYVRQAVRMLTKALRDHERAAGIVDVAPNAQVHRTGEASSGATPCSALPTKETP